MIVTFVADSFTVSDGSSQQLHVLLGKKQYHYTYSFSNEMILMALIWIEISVLSLDYFMQKNSQQIEGYRWPG